MQPLHKHDMSQRPNIVGPFHKLMGRLSQWLEINGNGPALLLHPRQIGIIPTGHLTMT